MRYPINYITVVQPKSAKHPRGDDYGFYSWIHKYQPVYASEKGEVIYKKTQPKGGKTIVIKHKGCCSVYAHLDSWCVDVGQKVALGQKIGKMGATGKADGMHLHYELIKGDKVTFTNKDEILNPDKYLCVYKNQKVKNNDKNKKYVKNYSKKATTDLWVHNKKNYNANSRVCILKKNEETPYYGKDGSFAIVDNFNNYYCSEKYLK